MARRGGDGGRGGARGSPSSSSSMRALSDPRRGGMRPRWPRRHARAPRVRNGVTTSDVIAAASELPGGFACSAHSRTECVVRSLSAKVTLIVTQTAASVRVISGAVPRRSSPSRRSLCRWLGVFAGDVRALWGGLGRALCAVLLCREAVGRLLPRWRQRCSAHGGVGGAGRWRRVVAVSALADVPGTARWLGALAGGGVRAA